MGPGPVTQLTAEAADALLLADRVLVRTSAHPVCHWLRDRGREVFSFDALYALPRMTHDGIYCLMADAVLKEAREKERAVYAVPGHPFVFETTARLIADGAHHHGFELQVIPGMSFLDVAFTALKLDPADGLHIVNAVEWRSADLPVLTGSGILIVQLLARPDASVPTVPEQVDGVVRWLGERFPSDHPAWLLWMGPMPECRTHVEALSLRSVRQACNAIAALACGATLYVPARAAANDRTDVQGSSC
jgi:tetrapyrrole methylase family protein/MazG family protein